LQSASIEASLARVAREAHASGEGQVFRSQGTAPAGDSAMAGDSGAAASSPAASASASTPASEASTANDAASDPKASAAIAPAPRRLTAHYSAPYLTHAAMEPVNCTARVADGGVEIWAPTQVPSFAREMAAQVAGVDVARVTLHVPYLGGSFGRRLEVDHVGQAVRVAMETGGRPVQLLWSREDDLRHDFYRPAAAATLSATLGDDGLPVSFVATTAGDALLSRYVERVMPEHATRFEWPDAGVSAGLADLPYAIAHQRVAHVATRSGVPIGFWRSVGHAANAFFAEGFIDELAALAGLDPLAYRMRMLERAPRQAAVLQLAADRAGWARPLPAGRARGVALHDSFGSVVAQVMEVSTAPGPRGFRIDRVVCAADVGTVVNPLLVTQQMEGAIVFGLSAALYGRIDIVDGAVVQSNFPNHPLLRLDETPRIEVHLVASHRPPAGAGEPGVPPTAPALANALFALTGRRLRSLPLQMTA
jgi:isoquinoline 1-oxidoreductase beta subunit